MNKLLWTLGALVSLVSLVVLIIALTDVWPNNPFINHKFLISLFFITYNRFFLKAYKNRNLDL
ncbi:hypothetical protein [Mangrovimonas sp. YM274]|uniref:hypothetical protein n=1 Tax=Mangrovimonas sp. YM274 TaxID=3070660 RepID=UPI0027DB021C|nr:hypothetical protein [Mangrovimonas sp. YM274]WMI68063.1 hypothetical protein RBH95_13025 [Mangrovimonas sp. YM274]